MDESGKGDHFGRSVVFAAAGEGRDDTPHTSMRESTGVLTRGHRVIESHKRAPVCPRAAGLVEGPRTDADPLMVAAAVAAGRAAALGPVAAVHFPTTRSPIGGGV